ncbi:MAG: radical SAM family heme chaperone HemW [bacterium]|nr:radical SAM family heme chaperone HemW [bacterium]
MSKSPGLYLHIPFCSAICPYCDFAVTTGGEERRERFTRSLIKEIAMDHGSWETFDTVYFGGGTPTALDEEQLGRLLEAARRSFEIAEDAAVSIEANPEDVTEIRVRGWVGLGVGRLSLGVQSFDAGELGFLGRRHSPGEARRAVEYGLAEGLTVSLDLIYGLPGRGSKAWLENLAAAVALAPDHLSCYQLTIEPGTPFALRSRRGDWTEPSRDAVAGLFYSTHDFLGAAGYPAYEVSNFASAPENRCLHNRKYWERTPYLGLGPSAHSFDGCQRWWNQRSETAWRREIAAGRSAEAERETLSRDQRRLETVMLGLRTPGGVDLGSIEGVDVAAWLDRNAGVLSGMMEQGFLRLEGERLVPTLRGMARADALARSIEL